jgi:hypothetical protein
MFVDLDLGVYRLQIPPVGRIGLGNKKTETIGDKT